MNRLLTCVVISALAGACSREPAAPPAPAAKPLVSGLDVASFDKAVRPQDDPFHHVNGAWLAKTEIPADKSSYGSFDMLFDKSQADLRAIVEEAAKASNKAPGSDAQKIGDFYESFMNEARAEELGLTPLEAELAAIDRIATKTDLARYFARMFKLNLINPLVGFVDGDAQGARHRDAVRLPGWPRPAGSRLLPRRARRRCRTTARSTSRSSPTHLTLANQPAPEATAKQIFALETRLARAHWTNVESRDAVKTYNKRALADLPKEFPGFDWAAWTSELGIAQAPAVVINAAKLREGVCRARSTSSRSNGGSRISARRC